MSSGSGRRVVQPEYKRAAIAEFICPDNGYRGKMERLGVKQKDFMKENARDLKSLQRKMQEERELATQPAREPFKLAQFKEISPRVFNEDSGAGSFAANNRDPNTDFLARGMSERRREELAARNRQIRQEMENKFDNDLVLDVKPSTPRKASVPRADDVAQLAPRSQANFVEKNRRTAKALMPPRGDRDEDGRDQLHDEFGRVPRYLEERKAQKQFEEEEMRRRAPDPDCPPGMKAMPEDERLNTLDILRANREEALNQLSRMPFVVETPSLMKRKLDLEMKLKEIENAIGLFSRPKVYIKI